MTVADIREIALPILKEYGVVRAAVFGSHARGEANEQSDVDMLVEIARDISLLDFIRLKQQMSQAVGREVDLVEYDAVKPPLKDIIIDQQVVIL